MKRSEVVKILRDKFDIHNKIKYHKIVWDENRQPHQTFDFWATVLDYDYSVKDGVEKEMKVKDFFDKYKVHVAFEDKKFKDMILRNRECQT